MFVEKIPEVPETQEEYFRCYSAFLQALDDKNEEVISLILTKDGMAQKKFYYVKETLLHAVARRGLVETATQLIKLGSDVNAQNSNHETPLYHAARKSTEMVRILINNGASVENVCKKGISPLHQALLCGSEESVQLIINKILESHSKFLHEFLGGNSADSRKETPDDSSVNFICHKLQNSKKYVDILVNCKDTLNLTYKDYPLLLFFAAKIGDVQIFKSVLNFCKKTLNSMTEEKQDAERKTKKRSFYYTKERYVALPPEEINYQGYFGRTALHYAVRQQLPEVVRFLLNQGADVNSRTRDNYTPLHYACCLENEEICKILLSFGALVNASSSRRGTPLYLVCGRSEARNLLMSGSGYYYEEFHNTFINRMDPYYEPKAICNLEMMRLLLQNGADPEILGDEGTNPLHEACRIGRVRAVKLLQSSGANLQSLDEENNSALHHAAIGNSFEIVDLLLKNGLDIEIKNENGYTPLLYATQYERRSSLEMIEYLVDCGANINAKNRKGATALHIAGYLSEPRIIEGLLELGADVKLKFNQDCEPVMGNILSDMYMLGLGFGQKVLISFIALREGQLGDYIHCYSRGANRGSKEAYSYFQDCKKEIVELKAKKICKQLRISFYDFLTRDFLNATQIIGNEEIRKVFNSGEYREEFSCYGFLLKRRFERVEDLENSVEKTYDFFVEYGEVKLPMLAIVKILSFLSSKDFRNFGRALFKNR